MIPTPYDDPKVQGSPAWWLKRLQAEMAARDAGLALVDDYYSGRHRMAFATEKYRERFVRMFSKLSDNWMGLVVNAVVERMLLRGFRIPQGDNALSVAKADGEAQTIWQRNDLDLWFQVLLMEKFINGEAHALVWHDDNDKALVTVEHPRQMIVVNDPEYPRVVRAALKKWTDDTGFVFANLYLPEAIFKFKSDRTVYTSGGQQILAQAATWEAREVADEPWPLDNPIKLDGRQVVPVVPFRNRPRLLVPSMSELAPLIPLQDAVNKTFADMLIASEYQAFRQRAITGIEIPRDPVTGQVLDDFYKQLIEKVWILEPAQGQNVGFWESGQVDLSSYVSSIAMGVQHLASQSETPVHYFMQPSGDYPSGESLKTAETPLVAKSHRNMVPDGESAERTMRLCFAVEGSTRAGAFDAEAIWANPESRSDAVTADAATKLKALGVPDQAVWEYWGASQKEIDRWLALRKENPPPSSEGNGQAVMDGQAVMAQ